MNNYQESTIASKHLIETIDAAMNLETPIIVPVKRGRGRPRKYPVKGPASAVKTPVKMVFKPPSRPVLDCMELIKQPGTSSVWGDIKKGKRFKRAREFKTEAAANVEATVCVIKQRGTSSVWGNINKEKRTHTFKQVHEFMSASAAAVEMNIEAEDSRSPLSTTMEVSNSSAICESDCSSNILSSDLTSDSDLNSPWIYHISIPGPIPDSDALFIDKNFVNISDFFADFPILEDGELNV